MASRQDQLHSYQFMVQRVVSALVMRETDPPQSPFRRAAMATLASVLIALIIGAGFGVYGVFTNRGDRGWQQNGAVIQEKESGAIFLYRDGKLHPVHNITSAHLASGTSAGQVSKVSRKSLVAVPRGQTIGIYDLPTSLPGPGELHQGAWSLCTAPGADGPVSMIVIGDDGARAGGRPVADDEALLVTAAGELYMLWGGKLYSARDPAAVRLFSSAQQVPVAPAFVNGMPRGKPLAPPRISGRGQPTTVNAAWAIGDVLTTRGLDQATQQYAVVRENDIAWVTEMQAELLMREPEATQHQVAGNALDGMQKAEMRPNIEDSRQPPAEIPTFITTGSAGMCADIADTGAEAAVTVEVTLDLGARPQTPGRSATGAIYADYVVVPGGHGALVLSGRTLSLVTDQGKRYSAAFAEVPAMLGYSEVTPMRLPSALVALLPQGPGMDPEGALRTTIIG